MQTYHICFTWFFYLQSLEIDYPMSPKEANKDQTISKLQDLNQPPLNLFDDTNLDLNLVYFSSSTPYTLGKVKFALERAQKEDTKKRWSSLKETTTTTKVVVNDETYTAGCPSCLLYVLISRNNPRCPRCNIIVPSPNSLKKPRIDLNITI